mgnify:CR=1 FL=1
MKEYMRSPDLGKCMNLNHHRWFLMVLLSALKYSAAACKETKRKKFFANPIGFSQSAFREEKIPLAFFFFENEYHITKPSKGPIGALPLLGVPKSSFILRI